MGDYRVIGGVTQAFALSVQRAISAPQSPVAHAHVTTSRPDKEEHGQNPRVNVYLFHAQPNPSLRNRDVPTFSDGKHVKAPSLALDLFYLLSFYGNDKRNKLESQLLMGLTMSALHAKPFIDAGSLKKAVGDSGTEVQYHEVALSIENMSVHELSRLWQTFPQVPLVLSAAYKATAVLVTEPLELGPANLVQERDFTLTSRMQTEKEPPVQTDEQKIVVQQEEPPETGFRRVFKTFRRGTK
ncbi:DUF4255 domain-containing protein [Sneathiella sp.]|jgi:hypothetical protein|uniref:DUF4255 domain-containing protein n=1 Tax=Sneathiella sp. TaxID=1964365 RepID=UPI0039E39797